MILPCKTSNPNQSVQGKQSTFGSGGDAGSFGFSGRPEGLPSIYEQDAEGAGFDDMEMFR